MPNTSQHHQHIREAIEIAKHSEERGNRPFGALLIAADGSHLGSAGNTQSEDHQVLAHAELNLLQSVTQQFSPEVLSQATLYTSAEPCPMCCGALFWAGINHLVFGVSSARLHEIQGFNPRSLKTSSREILGSAGRSVEVVGPVLEAEAEKLFIS